MNPGAFDSYHVAMFLLVLGGVLALVRHAIRV